MITKGFQMSLALVKVQVSDFDAIFDHLMSRPKYENMHLREACQRDNQRELRYLHAMHANGNGSFEIEGMISGPEVFWHYKLTRGKGRTQLNVFSQRGSQKALARMQERFLAEIFARVKQEQSSKEYHPSLTPGQFYLRRANPGMPASHSNCLAAVSKGVLDPRFVSKLGAWNFRLVHP
jgi:hypothetical protein